MSFSAKCFRQSQLFSLLESACEINTILPTTCNKFRLLTSVFFVSHGASSLPQIGAGEPGCVSVRSLDLSRTSKTRQQFANGIFGRSDDFKLAAGRWKDVNLGSIVLGLLGLAYFVFGLPH
jgi:hypothetical protein